VAAEEQPVDAPFVPHPFSAMPAPDSTAPYPGPISAVPSSGPPVPAPSAQPAAPARRKRRILLPVLIVVICLVFVGGGVGLIAYDKATAIDRSTPTVSVQQLLTAIFVEEDQSRVALFLCPSFTATDAMAHAHELVGADAKPSVGTVVVSQQSSAEATVNVRVTLRYPGDFEPSGDQRWTFQLANADGWRVCSFGLSD
jgi:hypothetical protein